ncbi:MAG: hypothetical protein MJY56_07080 [Bacteroidales bacterium]|nr:hypothetical protein [Bacteroidales bacterium]
MPESLRKNIERLLSAFESARAENLKLQAELEAREESIRTLNAKIRELENNIETLQLKAAFTTTTKDNSDAKARIDSLIKEIDRCIELLED